MYSMKTVIKKSCAQSGFWDGFGKRSHQPLISKALNESEFSQRHSLLRAGKWVHWTVAKNWRVFVIDSFYCPTNFFSLCWAKSIHNNGTSHKENYFLNFIRSDFQTSNNSFMDYISSLPVSTDLTFICDLRLSLRAQRNGHKGH